MQSPHGHVHVHGHCYFIYIDKVQKTKPISPLTPCRGGEREKRNLQLVCRWGSASQTARLAPNRYANRLQLRISARQAWLILLHFSKRVTIPDAMRHFIHCDKHQCPSPVFQCQSPRALSSRINNTQACKYKCAAHPLFWGHFQYEMTCQWVTS